jgi:hypothetical protein
VVKLLAELGAACADYIDTAMVDLPSKRIEGPAAPQPYDPCSVSDDDRVVLHNPIAMPVKQAPLITTRRWAALARP